MLTVLCLLAILGLGRCRDHVPTREEIEASINRTIEEVERKIQADPNLPRLSRKDIVDILQNITTKDLVSDNNKTLESTRNEYQRALMVVLPYNSNGAEENLKDLYTKPPMVQMISDDDGKETFEFLSDEPYLFKKQTSDNLIPTFPTADSMDELSTTKEHYKNNKEESESKLDSRPEKFSFNLENLSSAQTTTQRPVHTWKPIIKKVTNSPDNDLVSSIVDVVYSTTLSTTETPSSKSTQHVLTSNQWRYHPPSSTTPKPRYRLPQKGYFLPPIQSSPEEKDDQKEDKQQQNTKQDLTTFKFKESEAMTFSVAKTERPSPVYVTPMSESKPRSTYTLAAGGFLLATTPPPMRPEVEELLESIGLRPMMKPDNKTHDLTFDKKLTEANFQIPDTSNMIHSQSYGLISTGVESPSIVDQNTFENSDMKFKKGVDNLTPAIQLLFKKFGLQTSLNEEPSTTTSKTVKPTMANYNSYTNFKPLPNSSVRDKEMRDFLARFGLGVGETRSQKAMKPKKNTREEPPSLIEAVPGNMKNILENIGLITKTRKRSEIDLKKAVNFSTTAATKLHVFKPHEFSVFNDQQRSKINELLDTVKKVQQGKANVEAVQKVADEVLETTKSLPEGPDPASLEEILKLYKEDLRNEVKRQQAAEKYEQEMKEEKDMNQEKDVKKENKENEEKEEKKGEDDEKKETEGKDQKSTFTSMASSDSMASAQELMPASVTTTTASSPSAAKGSFFDTFNLDAAIQKFNTTSSPTSGITNTTNLTDLEESFGGSTARPNTMIPTRRRTGLYFLVDWNTFLEVGEEGKNKVNLRFQPRVGDRSRFVKVTVP